MPKSRKWTKERRERQAATIRARQRQKRFYRKGLRDLESETLPVKTNQKDAIVFLRQARDSVVARIRNGDLKAPDNAHLLAMQALNILQGDK